MRKLYRFVPVLALVYGLPGSVGDVPVLEGKVTIPVGSGTEPATFAVEGMVFHVAGEALSAFAAEHGPGEYLAQIEGDIDLRASRISVTRITHKQKP